MPVPVMDLLDLQYLYLGPLVCQLQVASAASSRNPPPYYTNLYYLVYTSTNSGFFQVFASGPSTYSQGQFGCDRSLAGQQLAPAQLDGGRVLQHDLLHHASPFMMDTLIANSPTEGILVCQGVTQMGRRYLPGRGPSVYPSGQRDGSTPGGVSTAQPMPILLAPTPTCFLYTAPMQDRSSGWRMAGPQFRWVSSTATAPQ